MGSGSSRPGAGPECLTISELEPARAAGTTTFVHAIPKNEAMAQRFSSVWIEVSLHGFRLLRPDTKLPLAVFPWGQVHSWSHGPQSFSFRHFDDITKTIQQINLGLRDLDTLLNSIQGVVSGILAQRKHHSLTEEEVSQLVKDLQAHSQSSSAATTCVELMIQRIQERFLLSEQARLLVAVMPTLFDKMEAAVFLHARLIDQSHFNKMLEELPDDADRDNVWHRITQAKKASQALQAQGKQQSSRDMLVSCASSPLPSSDLAPTGSITGDSTDQNTSSPKPGWSNPQAGRHKGATHSVTSPKPRRRRVSGARAARGESTAAGAGEAGGNAHTSAQPPAAADDDGGGGGGGGGGAPGGGRVSCASSMGEQSGEGEGEKDGEADEDAHMTDNEATSDAASAASGKQTSMQS